MKICKIQNCNMRYVALGYCQNHYMKILYYPTHKENQRITRRKYYLKTYIHKQHKCNVKKCNYITTQKYCCYHMKRIIKKFPLDLSIDMRHIRMQGKNNPMWRGGIAEYPNHYLMKENRLIILMNNPKCEICKKPATEIHHKDFTKTNHKLSNLQAVCHKCNCRLSSKFYQKYGMTLQEIAEKYGYTKTYWQKHQKELSHFV